MPTFWLFLVKYHKRSMSLLILWSVVVYCCCLLLNVIFSRCCSLTHFYDTYFTQKSNNLFQTGNVSLFTEKWAARTCQIQTVRLFNFPSRKRQGAKTFEYTMIIKIGTEFCKNVSRAIVVSINFLFCRGYSSQKRN